MVNNYNSKIPEEEGQREEGRKIHVVLMGIKEFKWGAPA